MAEESLNAYTNYEFPPCKGCVDRVPPTKENHYGCHSTCEKYKKYRWYMDKKIEARAVNDGVRNYVMEQVINAKTKVQKNKWRRGWTRDD